MSSIHYVHWRPTDFLASKISRRPFFEQGVERLITAMICENGGPIALGQIEIEDIAHRGRCDESEVHRAIAEMVSRGILDLSDGLYMVHWLVEEIERVGYRAKVAVENGKKRGKTIPAGTQREPSGLPAASQQEPDGNPVANPLATHAGTNTITITNTITKTNPITTPSPTPLGNSGGGEDVWIPKPTPEAVAAAAGWQTPTTPSAPVNASGTTAGKLPATPDCCTILATGAVMAESPSFAKFWQAYPKKNSRSETAEAWNQAMIAGYKPEDIIPAIAPSLAGTEAKFLPKPSVWLADRRWIGVSIPAPAPRPLTQEEIAAKEAEKAAEAKRRDEEREAKKKADEAYFAEERVKILAITQQAREKGLIPQ